MEVDNKNSSKNVRKKFGFFIFPVRLLTNIIWNIKITPFFL